MAEEDNQWTMIQEKIRNGRASLEGKKKEEIADTPASDNRQESIVKPRSRKPKKSDESDVTSKVDLRVHLDKEFAARLRLVLLYKGVTCASVVRKLLEDYVVKCMKEDDMKKFISASMSIKGE